VNCKVYSDLSKFYKDSEGFLGLENFVKQKKNNFGQSRLYFFQKNAKAFLKSSSELFSLLIFQSIILIFFSSAS